MSIFNRSKTDKSESDKSSSEESKTVSTRSDSVSDDDSQQSPKVKSKAKDNAPTKMDNAREVFAEMFGKDGIARKDIILAFQMDRVKLTKAGAGTYYAKLKREHLDIIGKKG